MLGAVTDVIRERGGEETDVNYFAALLTTLEETAARGSAEVYTRGGFLPITGRISHGLFGSFGNYWSGIVIITFVAPLVLFCRSNGRSWGCWGWSSSGFPASCSRTSFPRCPSCSTTC